MMAPRRSTLTAHIKSKLGDTTNSNREHHDGATECRGQQRHGNGYAPTRGEELDAYVASVLRDEVDQRHAEEHGDRDGHPRRRGTSVTNLVEHPLGFVVVVMGGANRCGRRGRLLARRLGRIGVAHERDAREELKYRRSLVEVMGFEPTASTLRT